MEITRRIVTGHDDTGKAVVLMDGPAPNTQVKPGTGSVLMRLEPLAGDDDGPAAAGPATTATIDLPPEPALSSAAERAGEFLIGMLRCSKFNLG